MGFPATLASASEALILNLTRDASQDKSSPRAPTGTCTKVRNLGRTPCGRNYRISRGCAKILKVVLAHSWAEFFDNLPPICAI